MKIQVSKSTQRAIARSVARSEREWQAQESKYPWRSFLTAEEKEVIDRAEAAKKVWLELNARRAGIQNRAIQRAKFEAHKFKERT